MEKHTRELNSIAGFSMIAVGMITGGLYYGHMKASDLQVDAWPSILYGQILQLPMEQRFPDYGFILVALLCIWAGIATFLLPYTWGKNGLTGSPKTHPGEGRTVAAFCTLFLPKLLLYWLILPLEGTPIVLLMLESGLVMAISFFALFEQEFPGIASLKANEENAIEYLKLRHDDNRTALKAAVGSGFSIILSLLVGAVTFFYSGVLRYGLEDPRGLFPHYQTVTVVILAAIIMIECAYELVYRFYKEMRRCSETLRKLSLVKSVWLESGEISVVITSDSS